MLRTESEAREQYNMRHCKLRNIKLKEIVLDLFLLFIVLKAYFITSQVFIFIKRPSSYFFNLCWKCLEQIILLIYFK